MKPQLEKLALEGRFSYLARHFKRPNFDAPWHYHPEWELTYIINSSGQRFVGDSIEPFFENDLVLLASNLPHFWRNSDDYYQLPFQKSAEAIVVQFPQSLVDDFFEKVPEFSHLRRLLNEAARGIKFSTQVATMLRDDLLRLPTLPDGERFVAFMHILLTLSHDRTGQLLASQGYQITPDEADTERMKRILEFTLVHFQEDIKLEIIAETAHLTVPAFCRYFKKRTQKTYVDFLQGLRTSHARQLLTSSEMSVAQIGLECGFQNLSHFHQVFKRHTGDSPLQYRLKTQR